MTPALALTVDWDLGSKSVALLVVAMSLRYKIKSVETDFHFS